jgi:hypothetical protein
VVSLNGTEVSTDVVRESMQLIYATHKSVFHPSPSAECGDFPVVSVSVDSVHTNTAEISGALNSSESLQAL